MLEIKGQYETAIVYTDDIEEAAVSQILHLMDQPFSAGTHPRFMPDVHAGKGYTVGTTMLVKEKICPNLIGVDIGCGMHVSELPRPIKDLEQFDKIVREAVPAGMNVHDRVIRDFPIEELYCYPELKNKEYLRRSIGTLGSGNHFIEIDMDDEGKQYLVIHTGSRNLGKQVCEYYMSIAQEKMAYGKKETDLACRKLVEDMKADRREKEIASALKKLKQEYREKYAALDHDLAVLEGEDKERYLHDMKICQVFARLNREVIAQLILDRYPDRKDCSSWHCIHNYIDTEKLILRKGSISAEAGEKVIIPLNMRDGCIIGFGKGDPEWNCSAPHGAGRRMSRGEARRRLTMDDFRDSMKGIHTTSVSEATLDESPMAYKDAQGILDHLTQSVKVTSIIRPVYNFKAGD